MYEVKIHFPGGTSNGPEAVLVPARSSSHAKQVAESMYSGCKVVGNPKKFERQYCQLIELMIERRTCVSARTCLQD